jgi:hypothetical protein
MLIVSVFLGVNDWGWRGDFLNAEGAKVAQRAQKKIKRIQNENQKKKF